MNAKIIASIRYLIIDTAPLPQRESPKRDFVTREEAEQYIIDHLFSDFERYDVRWQEISTRRTRNLVGRTRAGSLVTFRTSGPYDVMAVIDRSYEGKTPVQLAKGTSRDSVMSRGRTAAGSQHNQVEIVALREELHPEIEKYFAASWRELKVTRPVILQVFSEKRGWEMIARAGHILPATRHSFWLLKQLGYTSVGVGYQTRTGRTEVLADFTLAELTRRAA